MVRLAHSSDGLALPQAVACFFLLFSLAQPATPAQYFVDGHTWRYGDPLSPGTIVDPPKQEQESQAKNNQPQDDSADDPPSPPKPKIGSNRPGTYVPRQHSQSHSQLLQDENGNYFLWLRGLSGADGASEPPPAYSNLTPVDPPPQMAPPRTRAAPAHRQTAFARRGRAPSYYYYYTVPTNPY
jgi:hypothetical protein